MKMKLLLTATTIAFGFATGGPAFANGNGQGIVGSPHDFNLESWNTRQEICRVCHVPHDHDRATQRYTNGLLWNHEVTQASYTIYDNAWSSSIDGATRQPDGTAKLCLGCHDGTVAIDSFDSIPDGGGTIFIGDYNPGYQIPGAGVGNDLHGTHPLSITYDSTADPGLNDETTTPMGTSGMIADVLDAGKVQCSSCHDVHDQESEAGTHLLRVGQTAATGTASGLCLTCHNK